MSLFTICKTNFVLSTHTTIIYDARQPCYMCKMRDHIYILRHDGSLYSGLYVLYPVKIFNIISLISLPKISYITSGLKHIIAQIDHNHFYVWGKNLDGQLGLGDNNTRDDPTPLQFPKNMNVIHITCGDYFTMFLLDNGNCYACGDNSHHQLGIKDSKDIYTPTLVNFTKKIIYMSCGSSHSLFITENHELYGCGDNHKRQLGIIATKTKRAIAAHRIVKIMDNVRYVGCESDRSMCLTRDNKFWIWGTGILGLGTNVSIERADIPTQIPQFISKEISFFYYGNNFVLVIADGLRYGWGQVKVIDKSTPTLLNNIQHYPKGNNRTSFPLPWDGYTWSTKTHKVCSEKTKSIVMTMMIIWGSKTKKGKVKYKRSFVWCLPREILLYILSYIPIHD